MFKLIRTLLDATTAHAEEAVQDKFAIELIGQHIRAAEAGLSQAKETLATIILQQRTEQANFIALERRIADLETRVRAALAAGSEKLAHDGAAAIAELENERETRRNTIGALAERAERMRLSIEKTHRRIVDLNQGLIAARAIEKGQKAQRQLDRSIGRRASLQAAEALLRRVNERSDPLDEAEILDAIDTELSQDGVRDRLEQQGFGPAVKVHASDVLTRLTAA